ncbi:hypothetical protein ACQ918_001069 [Escherichia coli]|uniref:hypothetical protein n=1 Tax=Escherichia coli TaxID=562 RepID=UPI00312C8478
MESMAEGTVKDLVASGHALADDMTGAPSVLVRCLATQLEVQLVRANALAAENAGMKKFCKDAAFDADYEAELGMERGGFSDALNEIKTPATDAFLAEVKTEARKEGAYFVANRMLAAWEAGFIDDTAKNAADIARMILTSTEFMANAPEGDFDRSFSDGVLEDIAAKLRKGGNQ